MQTTFKSHLILGLALLLSPMPALAQQHRGGGPAAEQHRPSGYGLHRQATLRSFEDAVWRATTGRRFQVSVRWVGLASVRVQVRDAVSGRLLATERDQDEHGMIRGFVWSGRVEVRVQNQSRFWLRYELSVR